MYCRNCGSEIKDGAKFCESCGAKVDMTSTDETANAAAQPAESTKAADNKGNGKRVAIIIGLIVVIAAIIVGIVVFAGGSADRI